MHNKYYLKGEDLWNIIGDDEKTTPIDPNEKKKEEIKPEKTMYVLFQWRSHAMGRGVYGHP